MRVSAWAQSAFTRCVFFCVQSVFVCGQSVFVRVFVYVKSVCAPKVCVYVRVEFGCARHEFMWYMRCALVFFIIVLCSSFFFRPPFFATARTLYAPVQHCMTRWFGLPGGSCGMLWCDLIL